MNMTFEKIEEGDRQRKNALKELKKSKKSKREHKKSKKQKKHKKKTKKEEDLWVEAEPEQSTSSKESFFGRPVEERDAWMSDPTIKSSVMSQRSKEEPEIQKQDVFSEDVYSAGLHVPSTNKPQRKSREELRYDREREDFMRRNERKKEEAEYRDRKERKDNKDNDSEAVRHQIEEKQRKLQEIKEQELLYKEYEESKDINLSDLIAQSLRAKLTRNMTKHNELELKIEKIKNFRENPPKPPNYESTDNNLDYDSENNSDNEFEKYPNQNQNRQSIQDMIKDEKENGDNFNKNWSKYVTNHANFTMKSQDDLDDMTEIWEGNDPNKKKRKRQDDKPQRRNTSKKKDPSQDCWFCWESEKINKNLVISMGNFTYLALPDRGRITEGHTLIVPMAHTVSSVNCEENQFQEILYFKKSLVSLFNSLDRDIVFIEQVQHLRYERHMFIECIPLTRDQGNDAPMWFKKALMETETEWSQHKKIIETSNSKNITRSVAQGFPYFHVEFGLDFGFAHTIEDEHRFPATFGKEILSSIMDFDRSVYHKAQRIPQDLQQIEMKNFLTIWKPFDWTEDL